MNFYIYSSDFLHHWSFVNDVTKCQITMTPCRKIPALDLQKKTGKNIFRKSSILFCFPPSTFLITMLFECLMLNFLLLHIYFSIFFYDNKPYILINFTWVLRSFVFSLQHDTIYLQYLALHLKSWYLNVLQGIQICLWESFVTRTSLKMHKLVKFNPKSESSVPKLSKL